MNNNKSIAFIKMGSFSHTNTSVFNILQNEFSDYKIDVFDIFSDIISRFDPKKYIHAIKCYGNKKDVYGKKIFRYVTHTPYFFSEVKNTLKDKLVNRSYSFTFQTQSLFDASIVGVPHFIYTDHTHLANLYYPVFNKNNLYSKSWIELEKTIYQNATLNFTMSSNITKSIIEQYHCDPNKVKNVFCGFNAKKIEYKKELQMKNKEDSKNILFIGKNWERKGGPVLIEAFKNILKKHHDVTLTIVGCSPKLSVKNCEVIGNVDLSEIPKYYQKADIFCMPTLLEPFGIVFIEAMNYGLPIVATKIGAIPDFISDDKNGYLVKPNNTNQLTEKLLQLLENLGKRRTFGVFSSKLVEEKYSWENTGKLISKYIKQYIY